ncbi:uncharacterized protein DUF4440 [Paraburkholderia sp. BL6665CI2N2]|uniref:nuclear transport factor 2 family protein n=1 Tax=Paraburkholderia sp. BL6665CI2N2 TaxID=1938806 RepID=UPI00106502DC|nr:nuclear transport factor 2 family protein [Paraburkholderia sp. BL6665CI2N2]TDY24231.1 uncharacterized protein DUF4440 [Paraburkholderia sp. BL6665CI2N2]
MKYFFRLAVITSIAFSAAFPAYAADHDEDMLKSIEQTWVTAVEQADQATLERVFDDSFIEITASGARRTKNDVLLASPPPPGSTQTLMNVDVRVNGDTAIVTGINRSKSAPTAQATNYSFTDVFLRKNDGWRAVSAHMTRK